MWDDRNVSLELYLDTRGKLYPDTQKVRFADTSHLETFTT